MKKAKTWLAELTHEVEELNRAAEDIARAHKGLEIVAAEADRVREGRKAVDAAEDALARGRHEQATKAREAAVPPFQSCKFFFFDFFGVVVVL